MTTWDASWFTLSDSINREIWELSPQRGAQLIGNPQQARYGGLQDFIPGRLPWVPDIVGRRCSAAETVVVIGSAYAPFVHPWATRGCVMDLNDCFYERGLEHFQMKFLQNVVAKDSAYYGPIADLLCGYVPLENMVLMDLCRASFVRLDGPTAVTSGDQVILRAPAVYQGYVEAGADWTWQRLSHSHVRMVIALGNIAEEGMLANLRNHGCKVAALRFRDQTGVRAFTVSFLDNRPPLACLGVTHPSRRNQFDPSYTHARQALAALLAPAEKEAPPTPRPSAPPPTDISDYRSVMSPPPGRRVVGVHFICRQDMNVRHLGDGTFETGVWVVSEKHLQTIHYVALHESKSRSSYRQGEVLGWHTVDYHGRQRIVFHVKEDRHQRSWVGEGSGEKGYARE